MVQSEFTGRCVIYAVVKRVFEMGGTVVSKDEGFTTEKLFNFLKSVTTLTEHQSGQLYITWVLVS